MKKLVDILIPTFNNVQQLVQCLNSIQLSIFGQNRELVRFIVINNGHPELKNYIIESDNIIFLQPDKNLGWEGGLKLGLQHSDAPFVIFCNDDVRLLTGYKYWLWNVLAMFQDPSVAAVGPCSNFVMGQQNIWNDIDFCQITVKYLIGFFMVIRRKDLDAAGGVDDTLPGGDDIDLSIRLRDLGKKLICRRDFFVYHHGAQTGGRVHEGYWNSPQMQEKTNLALIKKHGMFKFWETVIVGWQDSQEYGEKYENADLEGNICRKHITGERIIEIGCGAKKTVTNAVGVDKRKLGETIPHISQTDNTCLADLVADCSVSLPVPNGSQDCVIARHILEHCQDSLGTLKVWNEALRDGGQLVIAVPNNELGNTVVLNPEHINSFTPASLKNLLSVCGFDVEHTYPDTNGMSMVLICRKVQEAHYALTRPIKAIMPIGSTLDCVNA